MPSPKPRSKRQRSVLACAALATLVVAACGGETKTVERTVTTTVTGAETTAEPGANGPTGPLGTSNVGPIELGMTRDEVRDRFGDPDQTEDYVNEAAGKSEPDAVWRWGTGSRGIRLRFDPASGGELVSYSCNDPALATDAGIQIGSTRQDLNRAYGDQLQDDALGNPVIWEGKPNSSPQIVFGLQGNKVTVIHGGRVEYGE